MYKRQGIGMKFSQLGRRTEFGREQVAASRDSAELQYGADQQRILMDKFQADLSAWGSLQLKPEATPVEGLPIISPLMERTTIPKPGEPPKPQMGVDTVEGYNALGDVVNFGLGALMTTNPVTADAGASMMVNSGSNFIGNTF